MAEFVDKARELGFTHIEPNPSVTPTMLHELLETGVPISSIHSPCPAALSRTGIPVIRLSLSSLHDTERMEAISFAMKTIDLATNVRSRYVVLHMGEIPIDLDLRDRLHKLYEAGYDQTTEYFGAREELVQQRISLAAPYVEAARKSLRELSQYSQQNGIMLGLETRFYWNEIPSIDEMAELLDEVSQDSVGYWHDVGHAEVRQRLGFDCHAEWLSRFRSRMIGVHLHDIRGISDHRAPGSGEMNWDMIAAYLPRGIAKVCEIGEWNDEAQMQGVVEFLRKTGILG